MPEIKQEKGRLVFARGTPASTLYLDDCNKICIIAPQGEFDLIEYFQWALEELKRRKREYGW